MSQPVATAARPRSDSEIAADGASGPQTVHLSLTITDAEVVAALTAHPEGRLREEFARNALRIGILALQQAQGRLDVDSIRRESERLVADLGKHLAEHQQAVTLQLSHSLKEYFDPESGRFSERVERLISQDGELEQLLRRQIGVEDSELSKTLARHFGDQSPIVKLLSPSESEGVLAALARSLEDALSRQRENILREFSLDNKDSALSRLVLELSERHGAFEESLNGQISEVVSEFSLDNEESALSRLVCRVETAQRQISREFSLDEESSALARMKRELLGVLETHKDRSSKFQEEVMSALSRMQARKEEAQRSTRHGDDFESALFQFLQHECQKAGDVAAHTGTTPGLIPHCKVGDFVIELGPDSTAAGARIVAEAKESASYDLSQALGESEKARKNRGAEVGLFVFSARTAPQGLNPLARYGSDVVVIWDAEDPATDVFLLAGLSVVRALSTRAATERAAHAADFTSIESAIRNVEKQAEGLDDVTRHTETIKSNSEKILKRARIMKEVLAGQVELLDEKVAGLKEAASGGLRAGD